MHLSEWMPGDDARIVPVLVWAAEQRKAIDRTDLIRFAVRKPQTWMAFWDTLYRNP